MISRHFPLKAMATRLRLLPSSRPHGLAIAATSFRRSQSNGISSRGLPSPKRHIPQSANLTQKRWESTGDDQSGHIAASPNETIVFFDNILPLKLSGLISRPWRTDNDITKAIERLEKQSLNMLDPISMIKRAVPESISAEKQMKITEILPRLKDGGAFVKFSHPSEVSEEDVARAISESLKQNPVKPWFNPFTSMRVGLVRGIPWLEDLYRFPKSRLRVEFTAPAPGEEAVELSQEGLYSIFRKYGMIAEITSQPWDSKAVPKYAYVDFVLVRDAIMARSCLHGFVVSKADGGGKTGTRLRLSYEQRVKPHVIWNWVSNHPRIVIPILAALLATITVIIFDPIREFFIKAHVQGSFKLKNSRVVKWFKRQTSDILPMSFHKKKSEDAGMRALWTHRKDIIDSVQNWLMETADTFIVVQGPRGSGKRELIVDQALKGNNHHRDVLVIDCKPIVEARAESGKISKLAAAVGYSPVFSWANSISSMIDLAVQSTTGVKAGFSENFETQLVKILSTTAGALKQVAVAKRNKRDTDATLNEDAYLEAHPERRTVIVVDNFMLKSDESSIVYDKIAEWAATLVQNNVAHVIFLLDEGSNPKALSKALPDRVFRSVALGDLSPDVAKKYVISHLEGLQQDDIARQKEEGIDDEAIDAASASPVVSEKQLRADLRQLDACIGTLGGRLTDLEFLARRLKAGQSPNKAVAEIVEQASSEILKIFLLKSSATATSSTPTDSDRRWSTEQAWYLVREIASSHNESLRYNEILLSPTFATSTTTRASDGEAALEALAAAELVTIDSSRHGGRPQTVRAGRPVYQAAFKQLVTDAALKARMDLALLGELAKVEAATITKVESELGVLAAAVPGKPAEAADRVQYLLQKLQGSQGKIREYEREMGVLKKVLAKEA